MKDKYDLIALGEMLIDLTPDGQSDQGTPRMIANPGGAPANVLSQAALLGASTAMIGKVGNDGFGRLLLDTLRKIGVDNCGVHIDPAIPTTLAVVSLDTKGDRSFSFYRKPGADIRLTEADIDKDLLRRGTVFHFGSVSLTDEPVRSATLAAARIAHDYGCVVSFDPNYRPLLWNDLKEARQWIWEGLRMADIVKISDEELVLITGSENWKSGAEELLDVGAKLVLVSMGGGGAGFMTRGAHGVVPAFNVQAVDTTGAGDSFMGTMLYQLKDYSLDEISQLRYETLYGMVRAANAAGALTVTGKGAIASMKSWKEILELIET